MHIKATIVAYVFLVQCFKIATTVAYEGLKVTLKPTSNLKIESLNLHKTFGN